jgi:hypothetical protein
LIAATLDHHPIFAVKTELEGRKSWERVAMPLKCQDETWVILPEVATGKLQPLEQPT